MAWKGSLRLEIPPAGLRGPQGDVSGVAQPLWSCLRQHHGAQLEAAGWLCCLGPAKRVFWCCVATRECIATLLGGGLLFWGFFGVVFFVCLSFVWLVGYGLGFF